MLSTTVKAYGWKIVLLPGMEDPQGLVEKIRNFKIRDDDVLVAAYPKCGTHWLWEVTQMLMRRTLTYEKRAKEYTMLEAVQGLERLELEPSQRILNSHNVVAHLPKEIIAKKTKIIHVIRNSKDALVSWFWHCQITDGLKDVKFADIFEAVLSDNISLPSHLDYLYQWSEFEQNHPDHPIKHIYFEDMKKQPVKTIKELATFLNVQESETFFEQVAEACSFENMKTFEENKEKMYPEEVRAVIDKINGELKYIRKGEIGDWKNHFTVAQNERFEERIATFLKNKDLKFTFVYE
ncbi:sulfotransferase 6B1 [Biomphalaria glabrata]|nr:sulfotransferase 6B1-like; partial [Biomphalaria glabrata]